ncbi:MAG: peptide-methionine (S)-S-oxide reductase, partial [Chloroflexota bacterium]
DQYRSAIFYQTAEQERLARESRDRLQESGKFRRHIVTEITQASPFYRAEEYHQGYLQKQGVTSCKVL